MTIKEKAPDTITTWVIQAVTLSTAQGMCVAQALELPVKNDLFVKVHIPQTIVQGEQLELATTVYNMHTNNQRVRSRHQGPIYLFNPFAYGN